MLQNNNNDIPQRSIKSQVIIFLVMGVTLMVVLLGLMTIKGISQQARSVMINNASQITQGLSEQSIFPILSGSDQNALESMKQVSGFQSVVAARILLEDNSVFLSKGEFPRESLNQPVSNANPSEGLLVSESSDFWLFMAPVILDAQQGNSDEQQFEMIEEEVEATAIGHVQLLYSKENYKRIQERVIKTVLAVGFISIILLSVFLYFGLSYLFKPLNRLAKTMQASKDTGEHIFASVEGAKEIQYMATAYNSMMVVLDEQDLALKQHRDKLEQEVAIRTQELIKARDEAILASKHKSEFIANMSHELRTPIQSIIGYGELVVEELEVEGNFDLLSDMEKIDRNSQRLLQMINNLLDLAKIESGKMELNPAEVNLSRVLSELSDTILPLAQKNNNLWSFENNAHIKGLVVDQEKLEHILLNLLSNACKFTENGTVNLTVSSTDKHAVFTVTDSGIGLSEAQQEYIFDEFRQVDTGQARKFSGTGLGLSISKRFIDLMSGTIEVESKLGEGATFTFKLPISV